MIGMALDVPPISFILVRILFFRSGVIVFTCDSETQVLFHSFPIFSNGISSRGFCAIAHDDESSTSLEGEDDISSFIFLLSSFIIIAFG